MEDEQRRVGQQRVGGMVEGQVAGEDRRGGDHDGHGGRNGSSGLVASGGEHGAYAQAELDARGGGGVEGSRTVEGSRMKGCGLLARCVCRYYYCWSQVRATVGTVVGLTGLNWRGR